MMFKRNITLVIVLLLLTIKPVFAYIDPGSGSLLLYFLIGIFVTIIYSIKNLFLKMKMGFYWIFSKDKIKLTGKKNIVFYSEAGHYWHNFKPIIEQLVKAKVPCSYYTSDKNDAGLNFKAQYFDSLFMGNGQFSLMSLNYLQAKILVMTTPQLDIMYLKRSKNVDYFVHLIHSSVGVLHTYKPYAFDAFDCVMCSGEHQIEQIRLIERLRNLPAKNLLKTGLVYFDELIKNKYNQNSLNTQKTVLVAPTWGDKGLLNKVGFEVLKLLLDAGFRVILRPHPQSFISDTNLMQDIEQKCNNYPNISIDKKPDALCSMQDADIMVSDISGIIFDFAFVYEKPIIAFSGTLSNNRLSEFSLIKAKPIDISSVDDTAAINQIATIIDVDKMPQLPALVTTTLNKACLKSIHQLRHNYSFNYANAGIVAAKQIQEILTDLEKK